MRVAAIALSLLSAEALKLPSVSHSQQQSPTATPLPPWLAAAARLCAASAVSCALLTGSPAIAADEPAAAAVVEGSPVARETFELVEKYFLDRTFNGVDLRRANEQLDARGPLEDSQALEVAEKLVKSLGDRYTRVLTPQQAVKLGKYDVTGVGINLVIAENGDVKVGAVPPADSDAGRLGVGFGDVVMSINGLSAVGMTSFDALEAIQGDGASVSMVLRGKEGKGAEREVTLRKTFVTKDPVSYRLVEADDGSEVKTGYVKLKEFNAKCKRGVRDAIISLEKTGATRIVLDLRGNGGGVLDGALGIAGLFLERPLVLFVTDANGSMQPLYSREPVLDASVPLQVWVDQGTASSSEVLAAALRDNCRASLVGGTTYGKGIIQGVFGLSDGGALIETVASYSTPSRGDINKIGVKPDRSATFVSDVLGASFLEQDIRSAKFSAPGGKSCVAPEKPPPQKTLLDN